MREGVPRPSPRAMSRLAADVGAEVADLRTSLRRALDEAEQLQATGRHDLAAAVLEEQRTALASLHERLSQRLAGAAVEREAEHVLSSAPAAPPDPVPATPEQPSEPAAQVPQADTTALRLIASAAAAVVGVTILLSPDLGGDVLRVAGWTPIAAPTVGLTDAVADGPSTTDLALPRPAREEPAGSDPVSLSDRAITTEAPSTSPSAAPPTDPVAPIELDELEDLLLRLSEEDRRPTPVLDDDDEVPGPPPTDGDTEDPASGVDQQTGLSPGGDRLDEAVTGDPTVERRGPAR